MSIFRKLLGRKTVEELEAEADKAAADGQFGTAKLQLERALEKAPASDEAVVLRLRERIEAMRDRISESRMARAEELLAQGDHDGALEEASGAAEVAASDDVVAAAQQLVNRIRMRISMQGDEAPAALTRDDEIAAITAGWTEEQTEEYDAYGNEVIEAALALDEGHFVRARDLFERVLDAAERPVWLYRDVARARWAAGDLEGADAAFVTFMDRVSGEEIERALFVAHIDRARLLEEMSRPEEGMAEIEKALENAGDSPRAFAQVAHFLRERDHVAEARDVLQAALGLPGSATDPIVHIELALCESALGEDDAALARLDRVALTIRQQGHGAPREVERERARLLERLGRKEHAMDLHRRLAAATADASAFEHALEAARLAKELGDPAEAGRQLARAGAIADLDPSLAVRMGAAKASLDVG